MHERVARQRRPRRVADPAGPDSGAGHRPVLSAMSRVAAGGLAEGVPADVPVAVREVREVREIALVWRNLPRGFLADERVVRVVAARVVWLYARVLADLALLA